MQIILSIFFAINSAEVLKHVKLIAKCELLFET